METTHFIRNVGTWMDLYDKTGDAMILDRRTLKDRLKECGFDFSGLKHEDHVNLKQLQNAGSAGAVKKVCGQDFYKAYKGFCLHWAENFESTEGNRPLPKLKNINANRAKKASESRISGMLHFLHFMVSFAGGDLYSEKFSKYLEIMDTNGQLWQQRGFDDVRSKVEVGGKNIKIGSIPPGFAKDAWNFIEEYNNKHV